MLFCNPKLKKFYLSLCGKVKNLRTKVRNIFSQTLDFVMRAIKGRRRMQFRQLLQVYCHQVRSMRLRSRFLIKHRRSHSKFIVVHRIWQSSVEKRFLFISQSLQLVQIYKVPFRVLVSFYCCFSLTYTLLIFLAKQLSEWFGIFSRYQSATCFEKLGLHIVFLYSYVRTCSWIEHYLEL